MCIWDGRMSDFYVFVGIGILVNCLIMVSILLMFFSGCLRCC